MRMRLRKTIIIMSFLFRERPRKKFLSDI